MLLPSHKPTVFTSDDWPRAVLSMSWRTDMIIGGQCLRSPWCSCGMLIEHKDVIRSAVESVLMQISDQSVTLCRADRAAQAVLLEWGSAQ